MPTAMEPRIVEAPGGGIIRNADPRHVPDRAWTNGRNVRFPTGGTRIRKVDGYAALDDPDGPREPLRAIWWYTPPSGMGSVLVRIGLTGAWTGRGETLTRIATFVPRTLDNIVTIDQYVGTLIWTDGIEVWTWNGADEATVLMEAPVGALVEIHKDRVLLGNIPNQPWLLTYSAVGLYNDWTADDSSDYEFLDDSTPLTAIKLLGDHVIIHKPNRLYRFINVGPPDHYLAEGIPADDGAISPRAPISIGSYQFYMGRTNFYRLGSFAEPIGDAIWPEVTAAIDWTRAHWTYAYRRLEWDEICWKIAAVGSAQPNLTVIYNYRDQTWTLTDHDPGTCFTELPPTLRTAPMDENARPIQGAFGQMSGKVQVYGGVNADGAPIYPWVESRHFTDGVLPAKILALPIFATGHGTLRCTVRAAMDARTPMPAWGPPRVLALDPQQYQPWVDVRAYGRLWQVRLESIALDDDWEVAAYGAAVIPGGYAR